MRVSADLFLQEKPRLSRPLARPPLPRETHHGNMGLLGEPSGNYGAAGRTFGGGHFQENEEAPKHVFFFYGFFAFLMLGPW